MLRTGRFVSIMAVAGLLFLYIPILLMMVLSFNASRLVSVWGGFSLKWYGELFANDQLLGAAWLSVKVAAVSATLTVVLGTLAGYVLTRFGPFRGRAMMAGMVTAPLVMPEVITGLSLLLLFVAMEDFIGWPQGRSPTTIIIAHATFCMAYVTIIVQSRLAQMDGVLEEAAQDLGARPWRAFVDVTLPMLAPALVSGWLLAFTLSFDDLVIASFVSGPGSSTLPMVIFSKVRLGVSPDVNALATLLIGFVGACVFIYSWRVGRRARQRDA
ncbi:ABC transporter permease subunit [Mycoplana dimorpha]|uniref:ABC-type spermidine/putrescine transport system permease subunit II n=1 Tax=Mycoplana dimorpha TaxID=28320 RepID=A0A2T5B386_MYCDI|nr:ABC transporter permease subunit [Mycoplana dimorpha]PTM93446.1 ABC-type spermidine/putrescine transport system permease subunit II [Mycoplana dimorpha]